MTEYLTSCHPISIRAASFMLTEILNFRPGYVKRIFYDRLISGIVDNMFCLFANLKHVREVLLEEF
jgi:hypothetical protein